MMSKTTEIQVSTPTVETENSQCFDVIKEINVIEVSETSKFDICSSNTQTIDLFDSYITKEGNPTNPFINQDIPPKLEGLIAIEGAIMIQLKWIPSTFHSHAYTEVYRADVDDINAAILVGSSKSSVYMDTVCPNKTYYYWIRSVSYSGQKSEWNSVNGLVAESGKNNNCFAEWMENIINDIVNNGVDGSNSGGGDVPNGLVEWLNEFGEINKKLIDIGIEVDEAKAAVTIEAIVRLSETEALAQLITTVEANLSSDITTKFQETITALSTLDESMVQQLITLQSTFNTAISEANASIEIERLTRTNAFEAVAMERNLLEANFNTAISEAHAAINLERTARSTAVDAVANQLLQLDTKFTTDLSQAIAGAMVEIGSISSATEAVASQVTSLNADFNTLGTSTSSSIYEEMIARSTAVESLAQVITNLDTSFSSRDAETRGMISLESTARSTADGALALQIQQLSADFSNDISATNASIYNESVARADSVNAVALDLSNYKTEINNSDFATNGSVDTKIGLISGPSGTIATSIEDLKTEYIEPTFATKAGVTQEILSLSGPNGSITTSIENLKTEYIEPTFATKTNVSEEINAISGPNGSIVTSIENLKTEYIEPTFATKTGVTQEINALSGPTGAITTAIQSFQSEYVDANFPTKSGVTQEITAIAGPDSALAQSIASVSSTVNDQSLTIDTIAESIDGIEGRWGVSIDGGNRVTGIQLIGGETSSSFIIRANHFELQDTSGNVMIGSTGVDYAKGVTGGPPADATVNNGKWANLTDSISSTNINSYFSPRAVTGTYIADLAVGTLKIGANAVSTISVFQNSPSLAIGSGYGQYLVGNVYNNSPVTMTVTVLGIMRLGTSSSPSGYEPFFRTMNRITQSNAIPIGSSNVTGRSLIGDGSGTTSGDYVVMSAETTIPANHYRHFWVESSLNSANLAISGTGTVERAIIQITATVR